MKKLTILAVAFAAIALAACGNKSKQNADSADSAARQFEQGQIEASIKMQIDSLAAELGKLEKIPFLDINEHSIKLTKEEILVKPDYLISTETIEKATTLSEKYRLVSAMGVDKKIAQLYELPTEDYDKAIAKLVSDLNDPSFMASKKDANMYESIETLYNEMDKNGRINYFWEMTAASLVEQLYVISENSDKILDTFSDENAANITMRVVLILDAMKRLSPYAREMAPIAKVMYPLSVLNATTVIELKSQMAEAKDKIIAARKSILG